MSWQVKDEITEINNIKEEVNRIRDALFINSNASNLPQSQIIGGGTSGTQSPNAAGIWAGLQAFQVDKNAQITQNDAFGIPTLSEDRLGITTSNMVIKAGLFGGTDIKWIQGTVNDGQYIILKAKEGVTLTLKPGGNLTIPADVTLTDSEFCILIFYEDITSPAAEGNYAVHKSQGGGGGITQAYQTIQDEGTNQTQRSTMNFVGAGVVASDDFFGSKTTITIPGATGSQTPWLGDQNAVGFFLFNCPRIEFNAFGDAFMVVGGAGMQTGLPAGDSFDWNIGGGLDEFAITPTEIAMNVPLDMNLNYIKFQAIGIPPPPVGLEKRFLFCDTTDFDKLKARSSTGIIDLEGLITNMGNLNAPTQIDEDLTFVAGTFKTIDFDGFMTSFTANSGGAVLPGQPVSFLNIRVNGVNYRVPFYLP